MVKLTQNIEAAFQAERTAGAGDSYGDPTPASALVHIALLDTFDPRSVEMNITPVASIGQSTEGFHASGPIAVNVPIKVACQGTNTGWQELIGRAIGGATGTGISTPTPHCLSNTIDSMSLLVRDNSNNQYTLATGVVPNEVTLEADYTAGGYITVDAACSAFFKEDSDNANFTESDEFLNDNFSSSTFPAAPTADPLLPTDLSVTVGLAAATNKLVVDGPAASYIEVGEKYMRVYSAEDTLSDAHTDGVIELASATNTQNTSEGVKDLIHAASGFTCTHGGSSVSSVDLLKGIYNVENASSEIFAVDNMTTTLDNLKTVKLMIKNNNVPVPGKTTRNSVTKWLTNNSISRGLADVTLEISMTAEDETFYDKYVSGATIPLIRLDFGASYGSIALTNGTITAFSRPMSGAGEIVDTMTIKFRGAGDYKNYFAFAISADWTLNTT